MRQQNPKSTLKLEISEPKRSNELVRMGVKDKQKARGKRANLSKGVFRLHRKIDQRDCVPDLVKNRGGGCT